MDDGVEKNDNSGESGDTATEWLTLWAENILQSLVFIPLIIPTFNTVGRIDREEDLESYDEKKDPFCRGVASSSTSTSPVSS